MKHAHPIRLVAALMCAAVVNTVGAAEPTPEERADALVKEAQRAATAGGSGGLEKASALLREAWALSPSFRVACNRGRVAYRRGEMPEAIEFLSICVAKTPAARSEEERARDKRIEQALTAALKKAGTVSVQVSEPGAKQPDPSPRVDSPSARPAAPPAAAVATSEAAPSAAKGPERIAASTSALAEPRVLEILPREPIRASSVLVAIGFGGSSVALSTGVVFSVLKDATLTQGTRDIAAFTVERGTCWAPSCGAEKSLADQMAWSDVATVSFITAGALAAGALTLWAITGSRSQKPRSAAAAAGRSLTVAQW